MEGLRAFAAESRTSAWSHVLALVDTTIHAWWRNAYTVTLPTREEIQTLVENTRHAVAQRLEAVQAAPTATGQEEPPPCPGAPPPKAHRSLKPP